jgi:hypothetical protein
MRGAVMRRMRRNRFIAASAVSVDNYGLRTAIGRSAACFEGSMPRSSGELKPAVDVCLDRHTAGAEL